MSPCSAYSCLFQNCSVSKRGCHSYEGQLAATVLTHVPFLFLLYIAAVGIARGDSTALLFTIGGTIASAFEPIVDVMGFCFFPREGSWFVFEWMGRPMPYFIIPCYAWFVGGQGYYFFTILNDKKTTRLDIWKLWLQALAANFLLEYPAMYFGMYMYYGYQPFTVGGFPLWFPSCHSTSPIMSATIVHLLMPHLKGYNKLAIIAVVSSSYSMANAGLRWPVWCALSADNGYLSTHIAATATFGLIFTAIWVMS